MKRKPVTRHLDTQKGREEYAKVKTEAQAAADRDGFDRGIEAFDGPLAYVRSFMLPNKESRCGFELRCEVVMCSSIDRMQKGHGCKS
jgi:hypothetical protein